ncbi:RHS repeat-associated core domain-containing protein [Granulicella sp. S190]|uniref:RHS repeat-associated core domain-containing protein n=1 Tax=Granulicella sp. S190 TaxID=1747226 RepID=UPI00131E3B12|nr:RHS repeat-associated core domain-containing protein [Granulicella sp. S190]
MARDQHLDFGTDVYQSATSGGGSSYNAYTVTTDLYGFYVRGSDGAKHYYGDSQYQTCTNQGSGSCPEGYSAYGSSYPSTDATGYSPQNFHDALGSTSVTDAAGVNYALSSSNYETVSDPAGNAITQNASGWQDTLGRMIPGSYGSPGTSDNADAGTYLATTTDPVPGIPVSPGQTTCPSGTVSAREWTVPSVGSGATQPYYLCYKQFSFQTAFDLPGSYGPWLAVNEASSSNQGNQPATLLSNIMLPNGTFYGFTYDSYLSLTNLTLPTGATIAYTWQNVSLLWSVTSPITRVIKTRTITPGNGQPVQTWNYQWIVGSPTWSIVTDPGGNDVEYQIGGNDDAGNSVGNSITRQMAYTGCGPHDTSSGRTCTAGSTLLKTTSYVLNEVFSGGADPGTPSSSGVSYQPTTTTVTWPIGGNTAVAKSVTTLSPNYGTCSFWSGFGEVGYAPAQNSTNNCYTFHQTQSVTQYDYGSGSAGALLQTATTNYKWEQVPSYLTANMLTLPSSVVITGGGITGETDYGYDESGSPQGVYGNQTSVTRVNNLGPSPKTQTFYNTQGMPTSTEDANGNTTSLAYDGTGVFLTQVTYPSTNGIQHVEKYVFDANTGLMLSHTDQNSQQTTYSYSTQSGVADPLNRLMRVTYPATSDGSTGGSGSGYKQYSYSDTVGSLSVTEQDLQHTSGIAETHLTTFDGLGRTLNSQLTSDPSGAVTVATNYDALGRVYSVSNPYRGTSAGITYFAYDALGRKTLGTEPDSNTQHWSYSGNEIIFTNETGQSWQRYSDALGRLKSVTEPNGAATTYGYNGLNDLTGVTQSGLSGETARNRSFGYNSLSQLITASNPETGTVCYGLWNGSTCINGYDANGNLVAKTDARGITVNYGYDALNRMTTKVASDGSFYYQYMYDLSSQTNSIGRLAYESNDVNASGAYNYDAMGRVTSRSYCVPSNCSLTIQAQATYDLAGNMTSQTYPDGRTISQSNDGSGRISSITYTGWNGNGHSTPYLSVAASGGYDPAGHLINATMGDGLGISAGYDSRERVQSLLYGTSTNLLWGKGYQWYPNSNLQSYTDAYTGISRQFTYDNLNRLQSAQDIVGPFSGSWSVPSGSSSIGSSSGATPSGTNGSSGGVPPSWTDPDDSNLLQNPDVPGSFGWSENAITFQTGITAPDGTSSAYNIVAATGTSTDGWVGDGTSAGSYSGETMTASVWLRSPNGPHTVNLYLVEFGSSGNPETAASKAVPVTTAWQQFSLSGRVAQDLGTLYLQIGGSGSVSNGQAISIWNPMMEDSGVSGTTITNFMPYSQRFTASEWLRNTPGVSIVDNSAVAPAPDGTNTASLVTASAGSSESYFVGGIVNPAPYAGLPVTASIWLRCVSGTQNISLALLSGTSPVANSIVSLTTTWQRFAITGQTTLNQLSFYVGGNVTFVSGEAILAWGAQIELASNAGPYVATGGSQVSAGTSLTNVLPYSQLSNGPSWNITGAQVTLAAVIAPDGSGTGTQVTAQANQSDAYILNNVPNPALYDGATVTGSVFLRVASGTQTVSIGFGADAPGRIYVGLETVTLNTSWQRFAISGQLPNGLNRLFLQVGGGGTFSTGQSFDIWGTQVEVSPNAGPYVMTSALPVISGQELTNILPSSQQLNGPGWQTQFGTVAVNAATAPDGSTTAGIFTADSTATDSYISDFVANPSLYDNQTVTASVYLRVASGTLNTTLFLNNVGDAGWQIQQSAPVTLTTTWQRFSVTATNQNGLTLFYLQIGGADSIHSGQSFQIWGAQMAVGDSPAPYTPTINGTTNVANGASATLLQNGLNQTYSYDSFGNIQQNGSFNDSYTAQNQMFGYAYDAAGNLLSNGLTTMSWDAESKLISTGGATYIYDPEGNRVEKQGVGVTDTIFFGGRPIARLSAGTWTDLIYGPNGMFAEVAGTETALPNYRLLDHLGNQVGTVGSTILLTNPLDYTPFGQVFAGSTNDPYMFTGKERDSESGLDYFGARYYASSMGRFMSPDWAAKVTPVPYAVLPDPQSLNLYSYVRNNPLSRADSDGHCDAPSNLKAGQVGVCVASYISSSRFGPLGIGNGDNRGTNGNGGSSRIQTTFTIDPTTGSTDKPKDGDVVAKSGILGQSGGLQGSGSSQISPTATTDANGNMHVSVDQSAKSAYDVGGALGDISNHINLTVTPGGQVGVDAGSTARQYPALEIYRYTTDGTTVTTTLVHNYQETTPSALKQPEKPLTPQAPQ